MSLGNIFNAYGQGGSLLYSGNNNRQYQSAVQRSVSGAGNGVAGLQNSGGVPSPNSIQLPSWLNQNPDSQLGELMSTYGGIQSAFDPSGQVQARNDAIGYNTSEGTQAANNAATEYANRATQSGGSALGAGVVKAQAMLPVLSQNAALKTDAADVAARAHHDAASLASQVASTIGQLRTSYLGTLAGYTSDQQRMQMQGNQFNVGQANNQRDFNYMQQQDQQTRMDQQRQQQLALAQSHATSQQTPTPGRSSYTVNPSGLGMGTNVGFADPYLYGNQQPGSLYRDRANNQLGGLI